MSKTRSAKGEMVDFDRLKIKQMLTQQPISLDVKAREDFIDKKIRRRMRKIKQATAVADTSGIVDSQALVAVETPEAGKLIDPPKVVEPPVVVVPQTTKQKNRPPVKG